MPFALPPPSLSLSLFLSLPSPLSLSLYPSFLFCISVCFAQLLFTITYSSAQVYSFLDRGLNFLLLSSPLMLVFSQRLGHCKQVLYSTEAGPSLSLSRVWPSRRTSVYRRGNSSRLVIGSLLCSRDNVYVHLIIDIYALTGFVKSSCGRGCFSEDCE